MNPELQKQIINSKTREYIYKIEWLSNDEQVIGEAALDVIDGSVNFDGTRSNRRSLNITLKNLDKQYIPQPNSKIWINQKFRFMAGYKYGNQELLFNQGVYCVGNPSILSTPDKKEVKIEGLDKYSLLDGTLGGKTKNKIIIPVGTRVDAIIKLLIEDIGEQKYIINECDVELPYTIEKEAGVTLASIIEEISFIVSYENFYNNEGFFVFRKFLEVEDYEQTSPSWDYSTKGLYLESEREMMFTDVRNYVKVIGDTLNNGIVISAIAQDNSDSDMSINTIGEKFELIEDTNIYSNELAQNRADWELQQRIMLAETNSVQIMPNFSHLTTDIISVTDENNGSQGNYVIQNINYNLSHTAIMNLGLWKVRNWR